MSKPANTPAMPGRGPGMPGRGPGGGRPGGPMGSRIMAEKPKDMKGSLKRLIKYIGRSRYIIFVLLLMTVLMTACSLAAPAIQAKAIDAISIGEEKLHVDFDTLTLMLIILAGVYLLSGILTFTQGLFAAKLSQATVRNMRGDLFRKIGRLPLRYTDSHPHGDIMSRMTNDVENISNTLSQSLSSIVSGALMLVGTFVIMLLYSPILTLVAMVTIPLTILCSTKLARSLRKYFVSQQQLLGSINGQVEEMVTGHKTVVAYGHEKTAIENFNRTSGEFRRVSIKAQIFGGVMGPLMNLIGNLGFLLIASVGAYLATKNLITVGVIQAFIIYQKQFTRPINELANQYAAIQTAIAGAERVFSILDEPSETDEGSCDPDFIRGRIQLKDVVFSYVPGEPVLKGINLNVEPGEKVAIVGKTGAGKTTIVNLLTRFYDIDSGAILLDGTDIRDIKLDTLRKSIGIVLQDTVLFSESIGYNVRYGNLDASQSEIESAAAAANADTFIDRMPEGYDTRLTESGANLSGGQRQLLSIARAVLADPRILILDEATSSVDTRTEMHIQEAMISLMENRTSLIIAHRLSTIRNADKIIVIDGGRIVEAGNHDELLAAKGEYYNLYRNQYAGISI